jgi:hypothetical protein
MALGLIGCSYDWFSLPGEYGGRKLTPPKLGEIETKTMTINSCCKVFSDII